MAFRIVNDDSLSSVADAIRTKGGTTETLAFPDGFVSAISAISGDGTSVSYPIENTKTYLCPNNPKLTASGVMVVNSTGLPIYDTVSGSYKSDLIWGNWSKWEIGMRIKPTETSKTTRVLCGCAYNGKYQYSPSIELYNDGLLGIGYTHTAGKWTAWWNDGLPHVDFGEWNFIRYAYDSESGTVTITVKSESGRNDTITFPEEPFAISSGGLKYYAFGQIAYNNNYASDVLFDLNNLYILGDGELVFGCYKMNTDPSITVPVG